MELIKTIVSDLDYCILIMCNHMRWNGYFIRCSEKLFPTNILDQLWIVYQQHYYPLGSVAYINAWKQSCEYM